MTKSRRRSSLRRRPFLIIPIVILLVAIFLIIGHFYKKPVVDDDTDISQDTTTSMPSAQTFESNNDDKQTIQNEGEDPNQLEIITGSITTARVSGDNFIIRLSLDQFLSSGTCELTMQSDASSYQATAQIVTSAATSTCEGFDIPLSNLSSGKWAYSIEIYSGSKTGLILGEASI